MKIIPHVLCLLIVWNVLCIAKFEPVQYLSENLTNKLIFFALTYEYKQVAERNCYLKNPPRLNPECKLFFMHISKVNNFLLNLFMITNE